MNASRVASPLRRGAFAVIAATALSLSGCIGSSPDARHYVLDPVTVEGATPTPLALRVGPVRLPSQVDQPQIAERVGEAEVRYDEFHRWAGGLEEQITRALAEGLASRLETSRVAVYPATALFPIDYRVLVDVTALDARRGEDVTLRARWIISPGESGSAVAVEYSTIREPLSSSDTEELVRGHRAVVGVLGGEIAARLRTLSE